MEIYILISICISLVGVTYSSILTEQGNILHGLHKWIERILYNPMKCRFEDQWQHKWIFTPLIDCYKCVSGQMALWVFLFLFWNKYILFFCSYDIVGIFKLAGTHIFLICLSIFTSCLLNKVYQLTR